MKNMVLLTVTLAVAVLVLASFATADVPQRFSYQGFLSDSTGSPVTTGDYTLYFSIYNDSTDGIPLWAETVAVSVESGLFNVVLGSHNILSADLFAPSGIGGTIAPRYLEVQVEGDDDPLSPRSPLNSTPIALVSSRLSGDVYTGSGSLTVVHGGLIGTHPYFEVTSDLEGTSVSLADPRPTPVFPDITIIGDADGSRVTTAGSGAQYPCFELYSGEGSAGLLLTDPSPTPLFPGITLAGDATGSRITTGGLIGTHPFFELKSDSSAVSFSLADPRPTPAFPDMTIVSDENGTRLALVHKGLIDTFPLLDLLAKDSGIVIMLAAPDIGAGPINPWPTDPPPRPIMFLMADEQGPKIVFGDPVTQNELITLRADTSGGAIEIKSSAGETQWKVEEGEAIVYQPGSLAKTVTSYQGIDIYGSDGGLATSLLVDGVEAPKANFGQSNTNTGTSAFVAGTSNNVSGDHATVPGGRDNSAAGDYSLAAGRNAAANHDGSFVWADASGAAVTTTGNNQFLCRAIGGTKFYTTPNNSTGVQLNYGSSQWQTLSSRRAKRNIELIDGEWILERIEHLPIARWNYAAQDATIQHISPMAEDFNSMFSVGEDSTRISTLDPAGVALAGVKELAKQNQELRERIVKLENLVRMILAQQDGSNNAKGEFGMSK